MLSRKPQPAHRSEGATWEETLGWLFSWSQENLQPYARVWVGAAAWCLFSGCTCLMVGARSRLYQSRRRASLRHSPVEERRFTLVRCNVVDQPGPAPAVPPVQRNSL